MSPHSSFGNDFNLDGRLEKVLSANGNYRVKSNLLGINGMGAENAGEVPVYDCVIEPGIEARNLLSELILRSIEPDPTKLTQLEDPVYGDAEFLLMGERYRLFIRPEVAHTVVRVVKCADTPRI